LLDVERQRTERDLVVESLAACFNPEPTFICAYAGFGGLLVLCTRVLQVNSQKALHIPKKRANCADHLGLPSGIAAVPPKKTVDRYCFVDSWGKRLR
jgi:hypothetical protein